MTTLPIAAYRLTSQSLTFSGQSIAETSHLGIPGNHTRQTDFDSCAVITLRNLFAYYGQRQEAATLEGPLRKLLSNILTQGPQAVDTQAMQQAFESFPPQMNGSFDIDTVLNTAQKTGKLSHLVGEPPNSSRKALSAATILLFMAECGMAPKTLQLSQANDAKTARDMLNSGRPLLVMEGGVEPLISRIQHSKAPITNHMFILHKATAQSPVLLYDNNSATPIAVPNDQLESTFNHPNTQALIVQNTPPSIPARLLGQPSVPLPL